MNGQPFSAKLEQPSTLRWVIDAAPNAQERDPERLMYCLLLLNVSAVHTTSVTFLNCMFDLASHPEIITELREEIEAMLETLEGLGVGVLVS